MIELDQNHGAVDPIVEDAIGVGAADPGKVGPIEVLLDFLHLDFRMPVIHVADVGLRSPQATRAVAASFKLGRREIRRNRGQVVFVGLCNALLPSLTLERIASFAARSSER